MKAIHYIAVSVISTFQILSILAASPFADQVCDAAHSGNCSEFNQAGGLKCVCNSYKPGSPVTFCSELGTTGEFQMCGEGDAMQKCTSFCGGTGVYVCEKGYCHSN